MLLSASDGDLCQPVATCPEHYPDMEWSGRVVGGVVDDTSALTSVVIPNRIT
jgi:hypothetical protein